MARGGRRTPSSPAPVSGPGALSRRTDGGPAPAVSSAGGRPYGQRQAIEAQESAAPSGAAPSPIPPSGGGPVGAAGSTAPPLKSLWRPTERPNESPLAGAMNTNPAAQSPQALIRVLYAKYRHPAIARLMDSSAYGSHEPR